MASTLSESNTFIKLKKSIAGLKKDIAFLSECRKLNLTPKSHKIKVRGQVPQDIIKKMESEYLRSSIKKLHSKLNSQTLKCYSLHLKLAKQYPWEFPLFLTKVIQAEECEARRKKDIHSKKLAILKNQQHNKVVTALPKVHSIEGFVVNRSTQQFSEEQLTLLNKGLAYAVATKPDIEQTIIDVETAITHTIPIEFQESARNDTEESLKGNKFQLRGQNSDEVKVLSELRDKSVYYVKADKGNAVVILDKDDYDNQMNEKITTGPYRHFRVDPLPTMVRHVEKTLKECKPLLGDNTSRLKVSNPVLPRIKGLPKIHKPGNEMREIISAEGSPTHKLAKWLVKEFQSMPKPFESRSVNNTQEFASQLQASGYIQDDEIMVSFDVKALFPSVPVKEAINLLEEWLLNQHNESNWKNKVRYYIKLTRLCMEENYFSFRGNFYKQTKGAPMGNPLSPFLSELFMANFESILKKKDLLPQRWWRYVDDVFSIIKKDYLPKILEAINSIHKDIKFTHEEEKDNKLPFLDLLIIRESSHFEFEIYRKPTNTMRVIPSTSNHTYQHKMAAFHHMIHRMQTLPLSETGKSKELDYIFETARLNGYRNSTIQAVVDKRARDKYRKSMTTLTAEKEDLKRVAVNFDTKITQPLAKKFRKYGVDLVFSSRSSQLKSRLGSTKDKINKLNRAGVYKISCPHCNKIYIGQTKRTLEIRFKEHIAEVKKADKELEKGLAYDFKSKVAEHVFQDGHQMTSDNIDIVRSVSSSWKLDVAESLEIYKQKPSLLLNRDQGNGQSRLFKFVPKKYKRA